MASENGVLPGQYQVLETIHDFGPVHSFKALTSDASTIVFWKGCLAPDPIGTGLIQNEAMILGSLSGTGLLKPLYQEVFGDTPFLVFPWKRFHSLLRRAEQEDPLYWLGRMQELVTLLAKVHKSGFVHGDIRPENLLIAENQAYLIDFGLAHTKGSPFWGPYYSPGYLAPEVIPGSYHWHPAADIFALGTAMKGFLEIRHSNRQGAQKAWMKKVGILCQKMTQSDPGKRPSSLKVSRLLVELEIEALTL